MLSRLESALKKYGQLAPGTLVVGVSGGPDSLSLLHALVRLGYAPVAAHLDHRLRLESGQEAEAVRQACLALGAPLFVEQQDVAAYARREGLSIEEAARYARYRFLFQTAAEQGATAVAVGHTADDQVETVLMHLLRGAGLSGLAGMAFRSLPNPWSQVIPLLRPLLGVWRSEIEAYVAENDLQPVTDASNTDPRFYRNRLRHEALPYLDELNPGIRRRLWQTAELLREDEAVLEGAAEAAWQACRLQGVEEANAVALHVADLRRQPLALQRRVLRRAIAVLRPGLRDIDYAAIQRALDFLHAPPITAQADLIAGLRLVLDGETLWLATWETDLPGLLAQAGGWPQIPAGTVLRLDVPGELTLATESAQPGGRRLVAEVHTLTPELRQQAAANSDPYQAWLDADALTLPLVVRGRRPGERFRPLGMGGHSLKLSDFMINAGMPPQARAGWPLVVSGEEITWVPGYRIGETFALGKKSTKIARLRIIR